MATPAATPTSDKSVPLPGAACGKRKTSDEGDAEMTSRMLGTVLGRQQPAAVQPTTWEEAECMDISSCPLPGGAATSSAGRLIAAPGLVELPLLRTGEEEQRTVRASRLLPALLLGMVEARAPIN